MRAQIIAIAFLLGCGGDGVDINTNQSNVCSEIAEVACHNLYQCCVESEIERFLDVSDPRTEAECRDDVRRGCARQIASLDFAVDEKRVRFDAAIMNDCLEALVAPSDTCATIETALPWTEACMNSAWIGLVEDGGACLSTIECASEDSFCGASRTCIARPIEGQPCSGVAGCATGLFCAAGTCRAQLAVGGACTSSIQCLEGLFCDQAAAPAVCAARRALGEACASNAACTSNQCNPGTCAGINSACLSDNDCFAGACADDGSLCADDSACAPGRCSTSGAACSPAAACAGVGETCVFPVRCNRGCVGDVVCGERHLVVDYCEAALDELPIP